MYSVAEQNKTYKIKFYSCLTELASKVTLSSVYYFLFIYFLGLNSILRVLKEIHLCLLM
jgi:hypothetical protein